MILYHINLLLLDSETATGLKSK